LREKEFGMDEVLKAVIDVLIQQDAAVEQQCFHVDRERKSTDTATERL
jgi:hypothetical protein